MFFVETTITIARPPAEVFAFVADMTNAPSWQPGLHAVRRTPPGPVGVGSAAPTGNPQEGGRP